MDRIPLRVAQTATGDPLPFFEIQAVLDGVTYAIEWKWNIRHQAWFVNVWDEQLQTLYLAGQKVVANYPLGIWITGASPPGALMVVDTTGAGAQPGLGTLGVQHQLYYLTAAERLALGA